MAVAELWETLKQAIVAYTGLSPAAFFTAVAVAAALYHVVSGIFAPPPPPRQRPREEPEAEPLPPPVQLGEVDEEDLRQYDGSDPKKPLLMAIKGQIYDVTQSRYPLDRNPVCYYFALMLQLSVVLDRMLCSLESPMNPFGCWLVGQLTG
jgi:hypothetical protein